jgi:hypothetical protein
MLRLAMWFAAFSGIVLLDANNAACRLCAFAQPPAPVRTTIQSFDSLPRPPIPADPLELVTGAAVNVQTAEQRLAAKGLLDNARNLSNVRAVPYDLKTVFITSGSLPSDGSWTMEDTAPGGRVYRWTAQGPNYSAVNFYPDSTRGLVYSNQPGGAIPLRLSQVREAIFFVGPPMGPMASIRLGSGFLNGAQQNCLLTMTGAGGRQFSGPRNWLEEEYCVDANTGLLTTYSPAPGVYVRYDYSSAKQFHGKTIPGGFTISEGGREIVQVRTESVIDPPSAQSPLFSTTGLTPLGVGRVMNPATRVHGMPPVGRPAAGNPAIQVVVLHGNLSPDRSLGETEILASSDSTLNQAALDRAAQWNSLLGGRTQPGATAQSEEMLFTFEFVTYPR